MAQKIPSHQKSIRLLLLYLSLAILLSSSSADPPYYTPCSNNTTSTTIPRFRNNLNTLLSSISTDLTLPKMYNTSIGSDPDTRVYVQFMCLNYITNAACKTCADGASDVAKQICPNDMELIIWEEVCQLRYSNRDFIGQLDVSVNRAYWNVKNISSNPEEFGHVVNETLSVLAKQAAFNASANMYATGGADLSDTSRVYALVQCTADLSPGDCHACLMVALANVSSCCYFSRGARVVGRSCYLRYELYDFYEAANGSEALPSARPKGAGKGIRWWVIIIAAAATALLVVALLILGYFLWRLAKRKQRKNGNVNQ